MIEVKCDRCGVTLGRGGYQTVDVGAFTEVPQPPMYTSGITVQVTHPRPGTHYAAGEVTRLDLCPECQKSLPAAIRAALKPRE